MGGIGGGRGMGELKKREGMWILGDIFAWKNSFIVSECPLRDLKERF